MKRLYNGLKFAHLRSNLVVFHSESTPLSNRKCEEDHEVTVEQLVFLPMYTNKASFDTLESTGTEPIDEFNDMSGYRLICCGVVFAMAY